MYTKFKERILVVCDSPLVQSIVHGGLQARFQILLRELVHIYDVVIYCNVDSDLAWAHGTLRYPAFSREGQFETAFLESFIRDTETARLIISLETILPMRPNTPSVLIMGGVAYDWSEAILQSNDWTIAVVPSEDSAKRARRASFTPVTVIPNGYDWDVFRPSANKANPLQVSGSARSKHLIHPHRPEIGKGPKDAIRLLHGLIDSGIDSFLYIPEQEVFCSDPSFYDAFKRELSDDVRKHLVFHDWLSRPDMPSYYNFADLTLALGDVAEGFGAAIVESIGSGTPVLATRRGAVDSLLPDGHGLFLVDGGDEREVLVAAQEILRGDHGAIKASLRSGRDYLIRHYSKHDMTSSYLNLFDEVKT